MAPAVSGLAVCGPRLKCPAHRRRCSCSGPRSQAPAATLVLELDFCLGLKGPLRAGARRSTSLELALGLRRRHQFWASR